MIQTIIKIANFVLWFSIAIVTGVVAAFIKVPNMDIWMLLFIMFGYFFSSLAVDVLWSMYAQKKMQKMEPLLLGQQRNPPLYIKEIGKLRDNSRGPAVRACCGVNIACAYSMMGDYASAKGEMLSIKYKRLRDPLLTNYWISYAQLHFESGDYYNGMRVCEEQAAKFETYREHPMLGGYVAILDFYKRLAKNETEGMEEAMAAARAKWNADIYREDWAKLESGVNREIRRE